MRRWRDLHAWFGVGAGLFLLFVGVTGGMLEVGELLEQPPPTVPAALVGPPVSASEALRIAEETTGLAVTNLRICRDDKGMWVALLDNGDWVYMAPGGEVVEHRSVPIYAGLLGLAVRLHTGALFGAVGHVVMLAVGTALVGSVLTGALIWPWLRRRMKSRARQDARPPAP